ncbi:glycoside hydrolase [Paenibacillus psychroresistens]|uniref:beta-N-acetylhexosaminidase n=1 Tax=Paenibacillus psychroresistens TaxID=1778678 RepID=A0A6B8RNZ1_9BACL|nr:family 20 glycosylhydrolase [Paenibacillus psychroresistens]QGQ97514.1 glycoside hydrolase [Paenibacillus psychroresistens]
MNVNKLMLVPHPKSLTVFEGKYVMKRAAIIGIPAEKKDELFFTARRLQSAILDYTQIRADIVLVRLGKQAASVTFEDEKTETLSTEGYTLNIDENGIRIGYSTLSGAFHAVSTLKQLLHQFGKVLPCLTIEDEPDFAARGLLFDISRNKIPTMETLFKLVDEMADLKMNQLQLYMEGFSFAYPSFPEVWETGTPMTGEDILILNRYCLERFIDLVPNQNSFGHMDAWLARKEFADLAECPGGYWYNESLFLTAGTLNPADPRSIELVETMQDDLLPYFSSEMYNVGFDETYELGKGKNKEAAEQVGAGRIYLDFLHQVSETVKRRGKRMMFWGDIIIKDPELITELPQDAIALEWGYEAEHPFAEHGRKFREAGVPFYVCPGTSCWNSIVGRTDNMKENLLQAAIHGKANGAAGFLNTHWYDIISLHHFPFIYPGLAYGAALSWRVDNNRDMDIAKFLNVFVFEDRNETIGGLLLDLGNSYLLEQHRIQDGSILGRIFHKGLDDRDVLKDRTISDFQRVASYVSEQERCMKSVDMRCHDASLLDAEFHNGIGLILLACKLGELKCMLFEDESEPKVLLMLEGWIRDAELILSDFKQLWLKRNRWSNGYVNCTSSGLDESAGFIEKIRLQCKEKLNSLGVERSL